MSNIGLNAFIAVAVILVLLLIALIAWGMVETWNAKDNTPQPLPSCSKDIDVSTLVQIPETGAACTGTSISNSLYYIGKIEGSQYDYVVAPWPSKPVDVCIKYCDKLIKISNSKNITIIWRII